MAEFDAAFERMIRHEGGYRLHQVTGDRGGQTFAGIARNRWPDWRGWAVVDAGGVPDAEWVRAFYREHFWSRIQGDDLVHQRVAESLFDFAVNAGVRTAVKLAQLVVGATPDGIVGPRTLRALNAVEPAAFGDRYALAKIARYTEIARRDPSQREFLLGWIHRALQEAA